MGGGWYWMGAAVAGTSHQRAAIPCQDAFAISPLPTGELIVAVADGAGSAAQAAEGAQCLVDAVCAAATVSLTKFRPSSRRAWAVIVADAFAVARTQLLAHAAAQAVPARNYAATLVLLILHQTGAVCGLVGDCVAVVLDDENELLSLCPPQRGEYANSTHFVIEPDGLQHLAIHCWEKRIQYAALFSDGLAQLAMNLAQNRPFRPFFEPLFAVLAQHEGPSEAAEAALAAFLASPRVNARTDDDKTLVLIQRRS